MLLAVSTKSPASWWAWCGRPVPRSVGGMAHRACTMWRHHCGAVHSGGSTVRPQRAICHRGLLCCCLYLLLSSKPVCTAAAELHHQTASSRQSRQSQSLKVPVSPTFLQRHCCCLSQGVKGPCPAFLTSTNNRHQIANRIWLALEESHNVL